jgi:[CysO sulfur-carrier protein]-S-L-cysteine hydrolase
VSMERVLTFHRVHWQQMRDHVDQEAPLEACGLLAGKEGRVQEVIPVRNQAQSPVRFLMDPYEQLHAFARIDVSGMELLGIFHSHPTGPETASLTDIAEAAYEVVHVIWSRSAVGWKARGFWIEIGRAAEIPLQIVE